MSNDKNENVMPELDESQLIYRQIERINRASGRIDKQEMQTDRGPQTWAHRYQSMVNELYRTVSGILSDEQKKDVRKEMNKMFGDDNLNEKDPFDRKEMFERKKELILDKLSEENLIFEQSRDWVIE